MTRFGAGIAATLGAVVIFGAQFPIAKDAYRIVDPYTLTAVRYGAAVLLLLAVLAWREGVAALSPGRRPLKLAAVGILGMTGSPLLVFAGLQFTLPEHAVMITALQPSMTALAQWMFRGRRPDGFTLGAIAVAFAGVALVVLGHGVRPGEAKWIGDLLVLSGAICWVTYSMTLSDFPEFGALRFTTLSCLFGTLGILAVTLVVHASGGGLWPGAAGLAPVLPHLVYLSLLGVVVAMLLWNVGNARIGPVNSMLLINLMPVETYLIRYLQGARFGWHEWAGALIVVGALVANNFHQRRLARQAAASKADGASA